jgi:hypothetical protein
MKYNCNSCHFFSKSVLLKEGVSNNIVSIKERELITKSKSIPNLEKWASFKCHKGVWDEGMTKHSDFYKEIMEEKRTNCFFYPVQGNMLFAAAEVLQQREAENSSLKRSNKYTRIGLWIAASALVTNTVVGAIKLYF